MWGRDDSTTCLLSPTVGDWEVCDDSLDVVLAVRRQCPDGSQSCNVTALFPSYTPICAGIYKFLRLRYTCRAAEQSQVVCLGQTQALTCPTGQWVDVVKATVGRSDSTTCSSGLNTSALFTCNNAMDVTAVLRTACCPFGQNTCTLSTSVFVPRANFCPGLHPFMSVAFTCRCPTYLGYTFVLGVAAPAAQGQRAATASAAEAACSTSGVCTGFNSLGYMYTSTSTELKEMPTFIAGTCNGTYVKSGEGCIVNTNYLFVQQPGVVASLPEPTGACAPAGACLGCPTSSFIQGYRYRT